MKVRFVALGAAAAFSGAAAFAAPLTPTIFDHDINFGAFNAEPIPEYRTNGAAPDTLVYTASPANGEVTGYWPVWPAPFANPVFDLAGLFGGDFVMGVQFTGQDAPYVGGPSTLDVSLTGTGLNTDPGAPDLLIFGRIAGINGGAPGLLWAIDLANVSLYGYSNWDAYVLEGAGTIVGGFIAEQFQLIGQPGVMRGHLDFVDAPAGWIPPLYDPRAPIDLALGAGYSGETGLGVAVPEPTTAGLILAGLGMLIRRR